MTKLRIGVIGAGSIAAAHLDAYAAHPDVELIAVADINLDRARAVADRYGAARAYDDAHDLLAADDIDGVRSCPWHGTHHAWAPPAAEARQHGQVGQPTSPVPCWPPLTSTASASAPGTTPTPSGRPRRSRPASTCWWRSRCPAPSPRPWRSSRPLRPATGWSRSVSCVATRPTARC